MKRYKEYRISEIEWLGEIPDHWNLKRIKHTTYVKGRIGWQGLRSDEFLEKGDSYVVTGTDFNCGKVNWETCYQITKSRYDEDPFIQLKENDLLITKDGTIGKIALVKNIQGIATLNSGIFVTRPKTNDYITEFMYWVLQSDVFTSFINHNKSGSTILHLYQNVFNEFSFPCPLIEEQSLIAQYLDHKTTQIDKLISDKEKLIELLNEERTAIINQAVTKGLNPDVPMKDSGIEWLGDVPEHWEVKRLKFIGIAFGGLTYAPENVVEDTNGTLVLRSSNIQNGKLSLEDNVYVNSKISDKLTLKKGDILICSRNGSQHLIGKNICIGEEMEGNTFGAFMMIFRSRNWKFLKHYFNSAIFTSQSGLFLTATINQLTTNTINNFWIAIPESTIELEAISKYLDKKIEDIEAIVNKTKQEIQLLKEYKTALISEVVTGKVDVRHELLKPEALA
jgi:type I restriction enzyme S subunit